MSSVYKLYKIFQKQYRIYRHKHTQRQVQNIYSINTNQGIKLLNMIIIDISHWLYPSYCSKELRGYLYKDNATFLSGTGSRSVKSYSALLTKPALSSPWRRSCFWAWTCMLTRSVRSLELLARNSQLNRSSGLDWCSVDIFVASSSSVDFIQGLTQEVRSVADWLTSTLPSGCSGQHGRHGKQKCLPLMPFNL